MIEAEEDITRLSNIFNLNGAWFCGELELSMNIREVSQCSGLLPVESASVNAIGRHKIITDWRWVYWLVRILKPVNWFGLSCWYGEAPQRFVGSSSGE